MARRPVRKIDPSLDLSEHLIGADQLPDPWQPSRLFGRDAPLEIEVGSGKGLFLLNASAACPEHDFLGIELARKFAHLAAARLARAGRPNARVVHGDAQQIFHQRLPDACAAAIHVYFPDPWWKKRHKKRRILTGQFLQQAERVLRPGGSLHFWTDVEEYFRSTLHQIASTTCLQGPLAVPEQPAEHDMHYRTHFERRMRLHRQPVYRAEFRRAGMSH